MYGKRNCEINCARNPRTVSCLFSSLFLKIQKSSALVFSFFQILTSVLQDTSVTSMLCVITPKDPTIALVRKDIMETVEIAQASFSSV